MPNSGQFGQPGRNVYISPGRPPKERSISKALEKSFNQAKGEATRMDVIAERVTAALETGWMIYDRPAGVSFEELLESTQNDEEDGKRSKKSRMATRIQIIDENTYAVFLGPDSWMDLWKFTATHTDGPVRVENDFGEGIHVTWNIPLVPIPSELMAQLPQQESDPLLLPENPTEEPQPKP